MGRKSTTAFETKLLAIEAYERGEGSIKSIIKMKCRYRHKHVKNNFKSIDFVPIM